MKDAGDGLTTARLTLRRFTPDDLPLLVEIYSDRETTRYLGGIKTADESREMLDERILKYYGEHPGLGMWVTLERNSGATVGFHLLNHVRGEEIIQVGYSLFPRHWGKGYA